MSHTSLWIHLDSSNACYLAGSVISGRLFLGLAPNQRIRGVYLEVKGQGRVNFWKSHHRRASQESYLNHRIWLLGSETRQRDEDITVEENVLTFAIQLPSNLPNSFYGSKGQVHYELVAHLLHTLKDVAVKKTFFVVACSDLNSHPTASLGREDDRATSFCLFRSGYIQVRLSIPYSGFVPGEEIPMRVEVTNQSSKKVSSVSVTLYQQVLFMATCHTSTRTTVTATVLFQNVPNANEAQVWTDTGLELPSSMPPTNLGKGCTIIDVNYYVKLIVDPGLYHANIKVKLPIVIGTIPFSQIPPE